jgi:hypothetical protein
MSSGVLSNLICLLKYFSKWLKFFFFSKAGILSYSAGLSSLEARGLLKFFSFLKIFGEKLKKTSATILHFDD